MLESFWVKHSQVLNTFTFGSLTKFNVSKLANELTKGVYNFSTDCTEICVVIWSNVTGRMGTVLDTGFWNPFITPTAI